MERNEYVEVNEVAEYGDKFRITTHGKVYRLVDGPFGEQWEKIGSSDKWAVEALHEALSELAERQTADEQASETDDLWTTVGELEDRESAEQPDDGEPVIKYEGGELKAPIPGSPHGWLCVTRNGGGVQQVVSCGAFHHIFDAAKRGIKKESPVKQPDDGEESDHWTYVKAGDTNFRFARDGSYQFQMSTFDWRDGEVGSFGWKQAFEAVIDRLQKPESTVKNVDAKGWFYVDSLMRVSRQGVVQVFADGLWWDSELPRDERRAYAALFDAAKGAK